MGVWEKCSYIVSLSQNRKMVGSAMICLAESEEELREKIAQDPYVTGKVWEKWDIYPYRKQVS